MCPFVKCGYWRFLSQKEVHFCLSNGQTWRFYILKLGDDKWVYNHSNPFELERTSQSLSGIVQLVIEWVSFSSNV